MIPFISIKELRAIIAANAVRQSPYDCPERLSEVLHCFTTHAQRFALPEFPEDFPCVSCTREDLALVLDETLFSQPCVKAWNVARKGNGGPMFVSRFSDIPADEDFIDLDALRRNIICEAISKERKQTAQCDLMFRRNRGTLLQRLKRLLHAD